MKVGDHVVLVKQVDLFNKSYYPGHHLKIVRDDDIRGFDLEDEKGNQICETRFIRDSYISIAEFRDRQIDQAIQTKV